MRNLLLFVLVSGVLVLGLSCRKEVNQAEVDRNLILEYVAAKKLNAIEDPSGLFYVVDVPGTGNAPTTASTIKMTYKGYLLNGQTFDATKPGDTFEWPLSRLILGWQIGIPKFKPGGKGILLIPSELGYGTRALPGIPANSVLAFDIELISFK